MALQMNAHLISETVITLGHLWGFSWCHRLSLFGHTNHLTCGSMGKLGVWQRAKGTLQGGENPQKHKDNVCPRLLSFVSCLEMDEAAPGTLNSGLCPCIIETQ